jgi:serine/threonine-protein kinase PknK
MSVPDWQSGPRSLPTQRDLTPDIVAELDAAGFADPVEIGRGGFGVVYRCVQTALARPVAIKVLLGDLDHDSRNRFLREERAMGVLSGHPNIVDVLQVDVTITGRPYIVMPYHARGSLDTLIRADGPLDWPDAVRLGIKLCGAVQTAHRAGILHRDIKPANVLLTSYGEPQLTDFGVARMSGAFETAGHAIIGSPAFTAPEVLKGEPPSPASDVYGLGSTLFTALTGHAAFERRSGEKIVTQFLRITTDPIPDLRTKGIPAPLADAVEQAMATDPADRPASAEKFGALLSLVAAASGIAVPEMALRSENDERKVAAVVEPQVATSARTSRAHPHRSGLTTENVVAPPPTASTKYLPPSSNLIALQRPRLIEKLRAGVPRKLTVIHGPAGAGKTSLATHWRADLRVAGTPVAWLRVDGDDNTVVWFLAHLVEAIGREVPGVGRDRVIDEQTDEPEKHLLKALIDDIAGHSEPIVVVLDGWHRITAAGTRRALDFLLDNSDANLRLVVISNGRAGLPLARMRLRDELVEIDMRDLLLDLDETTELVRECSGVELSDAAISALHEACAGWMAAIRLAAQSLAEQTRPDPTAPQDVIGGLTTRRIDEYLSENAVSGLEPKMMEFLMSISVVDRVAGGLATVLAGTPDGTAMLEQAAERDLFLRRADDDPEWFELQPLFAEFLRRRLQREHPGLDRVLHLHASEWFAQHKLMDEAVDHALVAADPHHTDNATNAAGADEERPRLAAVLGLVSRLPERVVPRSKIMMAVARANLALRQLRRPI